MVVERAGEPAVEAPSGNGEAPRPEPARPPRIRRTRRVVVLGVAVVVAAAWGFALWYSLERSGPEPLADAAQARLADVCAATLDELRALPPAPVDAAVDVRLDRLAAEQDLFGALVTQARAVAATLDDGAEALDAWLDDWGALLAARATFADRLAAGTPRRLVVPTDDSGRPVTVRMDEYARYHGLSDCSPIVLQAEVVDGNRFYPSDDG